MLQVLHLDVLKVNQDVAYIAMVHICCKCLLPMFNLYFRMYVASVFIWILHMFHTYVASILSIYCIYFAHMLQVFYQDVACVRNGFQVFLGVFASVSDSCFKCFNCLQTTVRLNGRLARLNTM